MSGSAGMVIFDPEIEDALRTSMPGCVEPLGRLLVRRTMRPLGFHRDQTKMRPMPSFRITLKLQPRGLKGGPGCEQRAESCCRHTPGLKAMSDEELERLLVLADEGGVDALTDEEVVALWDALFAAYPNVMERALRDARLARGEKTPRAEGR
jgi:hypothetical protein